MTFSTSNLQFLNYLSSKGIQFVVEHHGSNCWVASDEIERFLEDPDALFAKKCGVTKFDYRDWAEVAGCLLCSATLRTGKPCNRLVDGPLRIEDWLERRSQPHYCRRHIEGSVTPSVRSATVRGT